jgi:hypothetical protein
MESVFYKIAQILLDSELIRLESVVGPALIGCSREEIDFLEIKYNLTLPVSYKDFLEHFGHKADHFFQEVLIHYDDLEFINSIFKSDYKLNDIELSQKNFAFSSRYETEFGFFIIKGDDNPMVYHESGGKVRAMTNFISYMKSWIISNASWRLNDRSKIQKVEELILSA